MTTASSNVNFRKARQNGEITVLIITIALIFLIALFFLGIAEDGSYTLENLLNSLLITGGLLIASLFFIRLFQKQFLGNALKVEKSHFSNLKGLTQQVAETLKMKEPDVFIFQDPYLNAFSLGFMRPYTIALHSAIVEDLDEEELTATVIHESGHIWFGHTKITAFLSPVGSQIPVVSYIFGFWSRKAEISCDRLALMVTRNPRAVIDSLIKVYTGPKFLSQLDAEGILFQDYQSQGFMGKLAQSLGSHPFMTTRIRELLKFSAEMGLQYLDKSGRVVCVNCGLKEQASTNFCPRCGFKIQNFNTTN